MTRFENLLEGFVEGLLSEEELQEFLQLLSGNWDTVQARIGFDLTTEAFDRMTDASQRESLYRQIMQQSPKTAGKERIFPMYLKRFAAAAIFLLIAACGWLWSLRSGPAHLPLPSPTVTTSEKEIHPGGNKALLTLSDGTVLTLDSAKKGILSKQNNTVILKLDNGALACKPASGPSAAISYNTISTPRGGTYSITLCDGSKVFLNAASSLRFPTVFPADKREVEVTGEAYFEIANRPNAPFRVKMKGINVRVLGTSFNVNAYSDEPSLKVTLLDGAVNVEQNSERILLKPGQQALLSEGTSKIRSDVDTAGVIAWKNGAFHFSGLELPEIMRQISRWYAIEVDYEGNITKKHFTGILSRNDDISEVLKFMQLAGIRFRTEGKRITVIQ